MILLILAPCLVRAQELDLRGYFLQNPFLLNPALAGATEYTPIRLTNRHQWAGLPGAPYTQTFTIDTRLNMNGLAFGVVNDRNGDFNLASIQFTYAYHIILSKRKHIRRNTGKVKRDRPALSFGLTFSANQFNFDQRDLPASLTLDPALSGGIETAHFPDAAFGMFFSSRGTFAGFTASQLFQYPVNLYGRATEPNYMQRQYILAAGHKGYLSEDYFLEPSLIFRRLQDGQMQADLHFRLGYHDDYWFAFTYRRDVNTVLPGDNALKFSTGLRIGGRFVAGYAFEYQLNPLQSQTYGTHEAMLGYNLFEDTGKQVYRYKRKRNLRKI